jgi:hypothetical protein
MKFCKTWRSISAEYILSPFLCLRQRSLNGEVTIRRSGKEDLIMLLPKFRNSVATDKDAWKCGCQASETRRGGLSSVLPFNRFMIARNIKASQDSGDRVADILWLGDDCWFEITLLFDMSPFENRANWFRITHMYRQERSPHLCFYTFFCYFIPGFLP